jgi:hypothetical protein
MDRAKMKASSRFRHARIGVAGGFARNNRSSAPFALHVEFIEWRNSMTKFKTLGAICLAVSLAAASPALAAGRGAGFHGGGFHGGAHFAGGGFRGGYHGGGIGPGIAAGLIAGSVLGGAYGYYDAPAYYDDSYGYGAYDNYDNYDNPGNTFN